MDFSISSLLAGFIFSIFGFVYFKLGRRDMNNRLVLVALALFAYPYFVSNPYLCWGIGIVLSFIGYKFSQD